MSDSAINKVRIWDLPTRLFHWLLVLSCVTAWLTGEDARWTDIHVFVGYLAAGLITFRLLWGFIGGPYARFRAFVKGPAAVKAQMRALRRGEGDHEPGHTPGGGWAIIVMLSLLLLIVLSGVLVLGGEELSGPLAGFPAMETALDVHEIHELLAWSLLAVVVVHVSAVILESRLQRINLVAAMVNGYKPVIGRAKASPLFPLVGLLMVLMVLLGAANYFYPYTQATEDAPYRPFKGPELAMNALWQESCSECHLAYHPSTLPMRSWRELFARQDQHFEEDLYLEEEDIKDLLAYAEDNAADVADTEMAARLRRTLGKDETPLRITETGFWRQTHHEVPESYWKNNELVAGRFDCAACHGDAESGQFMNGAMRLPE